MSTASTASAASGAIARLRDNLAASKPTSELRYPFPLWAYLVILEKAGDTAFNNYCEGAVLLHRWLTHEQRPLKLPDTSDLTTVPRLAEGYLTREIAKIITGNPSRYNNLDSYLTKLSQVHKSIYYSHITTRIHKS